MNEEILPQPMNLYVVCSIYPLNASVIEEIDLPILVSFNFQLLCLLHMYHVINYSFSCKVLFDETSTCYALFLSEV